jgi:hypothetical protein
MIPSGILPLPPDSSEHSYLRGDGTWVPVEDLLPVVEREEVHTDTGNYDE